MAIESVEANPHGVVVVRLEQEERPAKRAHSQRGGGRGWSEKQEEWLAKRAPS